MDLLENNRKINQQIKINKYNLECSTLLFSCNNCIASILRTNHSLKNKNMLIGQIKEEFNKQVLHLRVKLNAKENRIEQMASLEIAESETIVEQPLHFYWSQIPNNIMLSITTIDKQYKNNTL